MGVNEQTEPDSNSGQPLEYATCTFNIAIVELLVDRGAKLENSAALHQAACIEGSIPMMKRMLELGADVNAFDAEIWGPHGRGTPLHHAIIWGRVENAKFLLENGADPFREGDGGHRESAFKLTLEEASTRPDNSHAHEILKLIKDTDPQTANS